jgi:hypothetical protein
MTTLILTLSFFFYQGGHFAALEQPALLLADVEEFVSRVVPL